jgi:very-short-patch-repair endonuclease
MKKHPTEGAHARARTMRRNMTDAERRLWQALRSQQLQGYKFRRQAPIGRYIADFICHKARLIVEIDGGQHDHSSAPEVARSEFLQNEGYRVLRFWNNEVLANFEGVYDAIVNEVSRQTTPTHALPHRGGGFFHQPIR